MPFESARSGLLPALPPAVWPRAGFSTSLSLSALHPRRKSPALLCWVARRTPRAGALCTLGRWAARSRGESPPHGQLGTASPRPLTPAFSLPLTPVSNQRRPQTSGRGHPSRVADQQALTCASLSQISLFSEPETKARACHRREAGGGRPQEGGRWREAAGGRPGWGAEQGPCWDRESTVASCSSEGDASGPRAHSRTVAEAGARPAAGPFAWTRGPSRRPARGSSWGP